MNKQVIYVGTDVDDHSFHGSALCEKTGEVLISNPSLHLKVCEIIWKSYSQGSQTTN